MNFHARFCKVEERDAERSVRTLVCDRGLRDQSAKCDMTAGTIGSPQSTNP